MLSTKVGRLLVPNPSAIGSDISAGFAVPDGLRRVWDFSRDGIRRSVDASVERLGTDYLDVALVHDPDEHMDVAIGEALPALTELRAEGVVRAIGLGMNQWEGPLRAVRETFLDVVMLAGRWTLLDRSGVQLVDECENRGVSILVGGPFNSGILAKPWPQDGAFFDYGPASAGVLLRARQLATLSERHGATLPEAALQFPLQRRVVVPRSVV